MPEAARPSGPSRPARTVPPAPLARHDAPAVDAAALAAARWADRLLEAARQAGRERWVGFLADLPDQLRDDPLPALRGTALRARAAYGPSDSIREVLPAELTEPFREAIDVLLRAINRLEAGGD
ncbi:MAG TPA: hypothetical protein VNO86_01030 [Candidatus Binatia bacterium]|nr:hypothetical protein [Candidatus Binatia bacterium]